jgi:hypothetical protein
VSHNRGQRIPVLVGEPFTCNEFHKYFSATRDNRLLF